MQTRRVLYLCCIASSTVARRTSLVGEIQAPYDLDLVGEALLHAADDRRGVGQLRLFGPSMAIIAPVTSSDATLESWNRPSSASHDARRRPAFHADDRGQAPAQTLLTSSPSMWMALLLPRNPSNAATASSIVVAGSSFRDGQEGPRPRGPWRPFRLPACGRSVPCSPSFSFHRILTTWLPSVLSVASMCRAVIFGSFSMRRVRFFRGMSRPFLLCRCRTGVWSDQGASANQDGVGMGVVDRRRVPKRHRSTTQSRHPFRSRGRWRKGHWRGSCRPRRKTWSVRECYALASFLCLRV